MTWEQAVEKLRNDRLYSHIAKEAYLGTNLKENVDRFGLSNEFSATMDLLLSHIHSKSLKELRLLDIGAGNGISSLSFAQEGFKVTALEPDNSEMVGNKAIESLKNKLEVTDLEIIDAFGENLPFENDIFSVVYGRQVMHHAHDLEKFVSEAYRVLKPGGVFMTARDHVVSSEKQKEAFLKNHPLHRFYGGENAFSLQEYTQAFLKAGFKIEKTIRPSDSPINYEPWSHKRLIKKFPILKASNILRNMIWRILMFRLNNMPGRLYSFIAIK